MKISLFILCLCTFIRETALGAQPESKPVLGILQHRPEHLKQNYQAGARMVVIELGWNRAEPETGQFNRAYFEQIRASMRLCKAEGYLLSLDFGFQYPPDWIFNLPHSRFVNQYGETFTSETLGEDIPNAVFNQTIREYQERYIQQVFKELGSDFRLIRLGWMKYGELAYPIHTYQEKQNCYWGFDAIAIGKAPRRPPGIPLSPAGDWKPGDPSPDHREAEKFIEWYLNALRDYQNWQIKTVRPYTSAPLAVLYPSWGLRPGDIAKAIEKDLDGSTPRESTGELQRGLDFQRLVAGIQDPNVIVYCTWLDSSPDFSRDDQPHPAHWSPAHYLAHLAATHPPRLPAWAENTGGGPPEIFDLCLQRIRQYGYAGFLWAFEHDLYDGIPPEIQDFKTFAERLQQPCERKPL